MSTQATLSRNTGIALKGGMFTLTTIQIMTDDLDELSFQLDEKINQAPNFFLCAPVILDVQRLTPFTDTINLSQIVQTLKNKKLIPVGIRGASKLLKEVAIQIGLAIFPEEKILSNQKNPPNELKQDSANLETMPARTETHVGTASRIIAQPIRSGQQIYVPGGDLIILSSVSHGAEILADGNIHVYGALRGRALAGIKGDKEAMIFCRSLEAELISIAGQYRLSEDLKATCWKESACIQLSEGRLNIRSV